MTDREIAERIVSLPLWSELFKAEARALIGEIEAALAAKGASLSAGEPDGMETTERAAQEAAYKIVFGSDRGSTPFFEDATYHVAGITLVREIKAALLAREDALDRQVLGGERGTAANQAYDVTVEKIARVSPDREALARRLEVEAYAMISQDLRRLLQNAAAFLRLPAQAEVETMAKRLDKWSQHARPPAHPAGMREAAAMLRRLSSPSPAVGEWRPIVEEMREACAAVVDKQASACANTAEYFATRPARDRRDEDDYNRMSSNAKREGEVLSRIAADIRELSIPAPPQETKP